METQDNIAEGPQSNCWVYCGETLMRFVYYRRRSSRPIARNFQKSTLLCLLVARLVAEDDSRNRSKLLSWGHGTMLIAFANHNVILVIIHGASRLVGSFVMVDLSSTQCQLMAVKEADLVLLMLHGRGRRCHQSFSLP